MFIHRFRNMDSKIIDADARSIVSFIKSNGGSLPAAAEALDITLRQLTRDRIKELEPNLRRWRHANQRFGHWFTLPTELKLGDKSPKINVICTNCSTLSRVSLSNLISGKSRACTHCAMKRRKNFKLVCVDTGEQFRSLRDLVNQLRVPQLYQKARHELINTGKLVLKGCSFTHV